MRKFIFLIILTLIPLSISYGQVDMYGLVGTGGLFIDGGKTSVAHFLGFNAPIKTDTSKGFVNYLRTTYYYVNDNNPEEIQGATVWDITQKTIGWIEKTDWYAAFGIGMLNEVNPGEDYLELGLKFETGMNVKGNFGFAIGADYMPTKGKGDKTLVYLMFDFFP